MKILKQAEFPATAKAFKPGLGDILGGGEYLATFEPTIELDTLKITGVPEDATWPWTILNDGVINLMEVSREFRYECPWRGFEFFNFVPFARISSEKVARSDRSSPESFLRYIVRNRYMEGKDARPSSQEQIWLGHGYSSSNLPSDGSGEHVLASLILDDGTVVVGWTFVWYNK